MIYIRSDLSVAPISKFSNGNIETILLKVKTLDTIIICVYRSQASDSDQSQWYQVINDMSESIEMTQANGNYKNIVMLGDYNFAGADWDSINAGIFTESESCSAIQLRKLSELMRENFMCQTVVDPTRKKNILDLVITNN